MEPHAAAPAAAASFPAAPLRPPSQRRVVFVQFGDYAEAVHRFAAGGKEDYYGQKYTVEYVAGLTSRFSAVTVIAFCRDSAAETLPNGVGARGILLYPPGGKSRHEELIRALEELDPTDLIVAAPLRRVFAWAAARGVRTLPLFADSFRGKGLAHRVRTFLLRRQLNRPELRWVANHSIAAAQELARIGVDPKKILPFDWPPILTPAAFAPKDAPKADSFRLLYVGQLLVTKGVGDAIRAVATLPSCSLTIIGAGSDEAALRALAPDLVAAGRVTFRGKMPHSDVLKAMRDHDAVLVPSHHAYPEGLPMTIYEALCTRTPVVASDHPMFARRIFDGKNGLIFREADPAALGAAVERLRTSPELYRSLSEKAGASAETYLLPLKWHLLLDLWLDGSPAAEAQIESFSLARRQYS